MNNRLGVFVCYDKNAIMDDYSIFLLKDMQKYVDKIYILVSGFLIKEQKEYIKKSVELCDFEFKTVEDFNETYKIILKEVLLDERIHYNEIVFWDDSFFGPVHSIKNVFDQMKRKKCDFWTMTAHFDEKNHCIYDTYFWVLNCSAIAQSEIKSFFEDYSVFEQEKDIQFSEIVNRHNLKGCTFIDINSSAFYNMAGVDIARRGNYLLLKLYDMAFIPIEVFINRSSYQIEGKRVFEYLKESHLYDTNMIISHLLRKYNIEDVKNGLSLNYILPPYKIAKMYQERKTALLVHLYYEDLVEECFSYLKNVPEYIDIYITTGNEKTYKKIEKAINNDSLGIVNIRIIENRGRDVAALLIYNKEILCSKEYEYIGFIHDKKSAGKNRFITGEDFRYTMWENIIGNGDYICNILERFHEEPQLGLLVPPVPKHEGFENIYGNEWGIQRNYDNALQLAERLKLNVDMDIKKSSFALSNSFWCRREAFMKLFTHQFSIDELDMNPFPVDGGLNHAIERIFPFVAQDAGYYTAIVENSGYAGMEITNMYEKIKNNSLYEKAYYLLDSSISYFVSRYPKLYIYGCGIIAEQVISYLNMKHIEYEGHLVTEMTSLSDLFHGKEVRKISDISGKEEIGIIVGLGIQAKNEVEPILREMNLPYFLWRQ